MEILGWIIWFFTCGYGLFSLVAFLCEVIWRVPSGYPQALYPVFLRRLITGFAGTGFIGAAAVTVLTDISKLHLLWFVPVWHFLGIQRWIEWIYLSDKPELIDLIYPESNTPWWFSLCCPFSPSLVPDIIRKIHKSRRGRLSANDCEQLPAKFVQSREKPLHAEAVDSLARAKRNNWPPKSLEEMNKTQRLLFWVGAGAFINFVITLLLLLLLLVLILLGLREVEECLPVIFGAIKYMIGMICISVVTWVFIYTFRDKK